MEVVLATFCLACAKYQALTTSVTLTLVSSVTLVQLPSRQIQQRSSRLDHVTAVCCLCIALLDDNAQGHVVAACDLLEDVGIMHLP